MKPFKIQVAFKVFIFEKFINKMNNEYTFNTIKKIHDIDVIVRLELYEEKTINITGDKYIFKLFIQSKNVWKKVQFDSSAVTRITNLTDINWDSNCEDDDTFYCSNDELLPGIPENETNINDDQYNSTKFVYRKMLLYSKFYFEYGINDLTKINISKSLKFIIDDINKIINFKYCPQKNIFVEDDNYYKLSLLEQDIIIQEKEEKCSICLNNTTVHTLCGHALCLRCREGLSNKHCPLCRKHLNCCLE
jgi:hypothetical protein